MFIGIIDRLLQPGRRSEGTVGLTFLHDFFSAIYSPLKLKERIFEYMYNPMFLLLTPVALLVNIYQGTLTYGNEVDKVHAEHLNGCGEYMRNYYRNWRPYSLLPWLLVTTEEWLGIKVALSSLAMYLAGEGALFLLLRTNLMMIRTFNLQKFEGNGKPSLKELLVRSARACFSVLAMSFVAMKLLMYALSHELLEYMIEGFKMASAMYLIRSSMIAKVSDVVADHPGTPKGLQKTTSRIDQIFDVMADGTFSKLIVVNVLVSAIFDGKNLTSIPAFCLLYLMIEGSKLANTFDFDQFDVNRYMNILLPILYLGDVETDLFGVTMLMIGNYILSRNFIMRVAPLLESNVGGYDVIPLLLGSLSMMPHMVSLTQPKVGLLALTILLPLDQMGFMADLAEEQFGEAASELDVVGNQFKGLFKVAVLALMGGEFMWQIPGREAMASCLLSALMMAVSFYGCVQKILVLGAGVEAGRIYDEVLAGSTIHVAMLGTALGYKGDPVLMVPIVSSGAINDNVKKVLNFGKFTEDSQKRSILWADLAGDFKKDVLFPLMAAQGLMLLGRYILVLDMHLRHVLGGVVLRQFGG